MYSNIVFTGKGDMVEAEVRDFVSCVVLNAKWVKCNLKWCACAHFVQIFNAARR